MPEPKVGRLSVVLIDEIPFSDAKAIAALIEKVAGVVEVRYEVKVPPVVLAEGLPPAPRRGGICCACRGTGKTVFGYSTDENFVTCKACNGTGKAP